MIKMKNTYFLSFCIFTFSIFLDQITKNYSSKYFNVIYNEGVIFGSFSEVSSMLRVSLVSSFFGIVFFIYLVLMYLISTKQSKLKYALSLFMGGLAGNVWSKILYAKTIDFIPLHFLDYSIEFNLADLIQWVGAVFLLYLMIFSRNTWFDDSKRMKFLILPKEQLFFSGKLCLISLCSSLIHGILSYSFLNNQFKNKVNDDLSLYLFAFIFVSLLFLIIVFIAGIFISHKIAGPFMAFERYVSSMINGSRRKFQLRKGDRYNELTCLSEKILNFFVTYDSQKKDENV